MSANHVPKIGSFSQSTPLAEQILASAQSGREVVQDFVPLADSLEWELGQEYLRKRGNKAFISDSTPIPFIINNDGTLSRNAAEVFFISLVEADKAGTLENDIFVLELGIGVGLFARFFLDHFQELCIQHKKNFYDRLCYIAADRSQQMLLDVLKHGIFANHAGHYCVRLVDAMKPDETLPNEARFRRMKGKPIRAVFLNYLLDCLPAAPLQIDGDKVKQLCVRTCVARTVKLSDYTNMTITQLQERAKSTDPRARQELLEVYGFFASEYDYRPVDVKKLPFGEFAVEFGRRRTKRILHSFGAIQCLSRLLEVIHEDGFILMNEYGHSQTTRDDDFEHQRFSYATAVGLNFPLLKGFFESSGKCQLLEPSGDQERGIHTRLLMKKANQEITVRFQKMFGKAAFEALEEPLKKARACDQYGKFELALDYFYQAIRLQPSNWVLMSEASSFLNNRMLDFKRAIDMAKVALALNPSCSAELWNVLGEALFRFGRNDEARGAFLRALTVNESDVRSRFHLARVEARDKDYPAALKWIAEAFALDKTGQFREQLLKDQHQVLFDLAIRNQQEYLLLLNLHSKYAKPDDKKPDEPVPIVPPPPSEDSGETST